MVGWQDDAGILTIEVEEEAAKRMYSTPASGEVAKGIQERAVALAEAMKAQQAQQTEAEQQPEPDKDKDKDEAVQAEKPEAAGPEEQPDSADAAQDDDEQPEQPEPPAEVSLGKYKALGKCAVRESASTESPRAGTLQPGDVIDVAETVTTDAGIVRMRFGWGDEEGWTSLVSQKGNVMLEKTDDDAAVTPRPSQEEDEEEEEEAPAAAPPKKSMRRRMSVALGVSPRDDEPLKVRAPDLRPRKVVSTRPKRLVSHR